MKESKCSAETLTQQSASTVSEYEQKELPIVPDQSCPILNITMYIQTPPSISCMGPNLIDLYNPPPQFENFSHIQDLVMLVLNTF